ncbi:YlxR family protein [Thermoleptolyngbya oregonensis NK1-22]|uniref:YlxR family protein n=1 Tax=Thermoleptolyngbya oregonensis NK1-22 TaxID=2547457 RepID=A0AA97BCG8_9CYAN|nr:YlxR family protein [Thermoleptolyngbya sp. M55_K2018_002]WOB42969.1 YlxR family protein [Thermoleptolyngbya oregonensis NK1-22]HIK42398.1 YlxR family protein [Thermoleptolyngbya sp. M55_K2018_002]
MPPPNYRRCLSCRRLAPKTEFWRIVRVYPSQTIQLDYGMGRSAYLCPTASCLQAAQRKDRLGRSLKVSVPEAVYQTLRQRLAVDSTQKPDSLGQAR